ANTYTAAPARAIPACAFACVCQVLITRRYKMDRRSFMLVPPAVALGTLALPSTSLSAPLAIHSKTQLLARSGKAPRVVICGGGWGGMTTARFLRELSPEAEVVLLERNPTFWSGPMSNKWLIDIVPTDFVNRDMLKPANKLRYNL